MHHPAHTLTRDALTFVVKAVFLTCGCDNIIVAASYWPEKIGLILAAIKHARTFHIDIPGMGRTDNCCR